MKQYKARDKITQKMTRDGAVEVNETKGTKKRPVKRHASPTGQLPMNGSRHISFSSVEQLMKCSIMETGFSVGCRFSRSRNGTREPPSAFMSISTGRTPAEPAKRRQGKHRQKQKAAPALPGCNFKAASRARLLIRFFVPLVSFTSTAPSRVIFYALTHSWGAARLGKRVF